MNFQVIYDELLEVLLPLHGDTEARSIAKIYLEDRFGLSLNALQNTPLNSNQFKQFEQDKWSFQKRMPVQYIVGRAFFFNHFFTVNKDVLIPRSETEELVAFSLSRLNNMQESSSARVIDIGTGSGCIAISIKMANPTVEMTAIDVSLNALEVAKLNANTIGATLQFELYDFLDKKQWSNLSKFDLIVSNPPYISNQDYERLDPEVLEFEPRIALTPSVQDDLIFYKRIVEFALVHLSGKGEIVLEIGYNQKRYLSGWLANQTRFTFDFIKDLHGQDRILHLKRI